MQAEPQPQLQLEPVLTSQPFPSAQALLAALPPAEAAFMQKLSKLQYVIKLFITGHEVGASRPSHLRHDFTAQFDDIFRWGSLHSSGLPVLFGHALAVSIVLTWRDGVHAGHHALGWR